MLRKYVNNSLHLEWKDAQILFCPWTLSGPQVHSFPQVLLLENCLLLGTDNVRKLISEQISMPKRDYSVIYFCTIEPIVCLYQ